jgi:hypothetical protein
VVVAVVAVRVMKMAVDQVIDVIPMRYRFVPTAWPVDVARIVPTAVWRTLVRVFCADVDPMFVYMIAMRMVQMSIMQIVDVVIMLDRGMSAPRAMLMVVVSMMGFVARAHAFLLFPIGRGGTGTSTAAGHWMASQRAMFQQRHALGRRFSGPLSLSIERASKGAKPAGHTTERLGNEAETSDSSNKHTLSRIENHVTRLLSKRETAQ